MQGEKATTPAFAGALDPVVKGEASGDGEPEAHDPDGDEGRRGQGDGAGREVEEGRDHGDVYQIK